MDLQTEQAVWRRVREPGGMTAEEALLPEKLEGLLLQELADAAALRSLARRIRGQGSGALLRAAAAADTRVRELTTLHYLLTGRRLRLQPPPPAADAPVPEALRELTLRQRQTALAYESLEKEFVAYAGDFSRFAVGVKAQARTLTKLLQQQLRPGK